MEIRPESYMHKMTVEKSGKAGQEGIALVMVLILSAIALAIMAALVYMLTSGTEVSGLQKRYKSASEAGKGGADITYRVIQAAGDPDIPGLTNFSIPALNVGSVNCLDWKLNHPTGEWPSDCSSIVSIDPSQSSSYDITFQLGNFSVYSKIVDTVDGNSSRYVGADEGLIKGGVVTADPSEVPVVSMPYLYTIEVDSENASNPEERAKYSILYQY